jgi:hypothetical protein
MALPYHKVPDSAEAGAHKMGAACGRAKKEGGLLAARGVATDNCVGSTRTRSSYGLGFFVGFQGDGADGRSQGDSEHDGEKLYPHGDASSVARSARGSLAGENASRTKSFPHF